MKLSYIACIVIAGITLQICPACKKLTDSNGLPLATQEGRNTLGFLLNGQPWTPAGDNGTANLSISIDFGYRNGIMNIVAYRYVDSNTNSKQIFGFSINDSLNFMNVPITLLGGTKKSSLLTFYFTDRRGCTYDCFADTSVYCTGNLSVEKFDKVNKIVSGVFNVSLYKKMCDTIKITEGRFDMKY